MATVALNEMTHSFAHSDNNISHSTHKIFHSDNNISHSTHEILTPVPPWHHNGGKCYGLNVKLDASSRTMLAVSGVVLGVGDDFAANVKTT